jgi:hypothetical protein
MNAYVKATYTKLKAGKKRALQTMFACVNVLAERRRGMGRACKTMSFMNLFCERDPYFDAFANATYTSTLKRPNVTFQPHPDSSSRPCLNCETKTF